MKDIIKQLNREEALRKPFRLKRRARQRIKTLLMAIGLIVAIFLVKMFLS
jgi:hypothetical protein